MSNETEQQTEQQTPEQVPEGEAKPKRIVLVDATSSMNTVRVMASEVDSGLVNVGRSNPALARDLRRKMIKLRDSLEIVHDYIMQNGGATEEPNQAANSSEKEEDTRVEEKSSENAPEKTEGTEGTSNTPSPTGQSALDKLRQGNS